MTGIFNFVLNSGSPSWLLLYRNGKNDVNKGYNEFNYTYNPLVKENVRGNTYFFGKTFKLFGNILKLYLLPLFGNE